jgi:hypothetical protein
MQSGRDFPGLLPWCGYTGLGRMVSRESRGLVVRERNTDETRAGDTLALFRVLSFPQVPRSPFPSGGIFLACRAATVTLDAGPLWCRQENSGRVPYLGELGA